MTARRLAVLLGSAYLVLGVAETVRLLLTGDGGFLFWFGTLFGGGSLVLLGTLVQDRRRDRGEAPDGWAAVAVVTGALLGVPATAWTLVLPLAALVLITLTVTGALQPAGDR